MRQQPVEMDRGSALRRRAEELLLQQQTEQALPSQADAYRMLHELQVHQIELELQNDELRRSQVELRLGATVFVHSYDGILVTDPATLIMDVNPAFVRITGFGREEVLGRTPRLLASRLNGPQFYAGMWRFLRRHDFWSGELMGRRKNGDVYAELLSIATVRDPSGEVQHYVGVFSDISVLKKHEAELDRIANYDALTGVPNRRLFADRLAQATARSRRSGKPLAVCYLDLDGFKQINDQFGHDMGDQVLIELTRRLHEVLRAEDTVARLGGDEFALLIDIGSAEECEAVLGRVLATVSAMVAVQGVAVAVSASIGVTLYPQDDANADILLRHADQAMYEAKSAGKNRVRRFDLGQDRAQQAHLEQLQGLRQALQQGEFRLDFQPKIDLRSGAVVGAEALLRWQHPQRGRLLPAAFLPDLVGTELEFAVGEWVIEAVLQQLELWQQVGLELVGSANISPSHLMNPEFPDRLALLLSRHPAVDSARLELEILETAALSDIDQAASTLASCRRLGVQFSLDDFGTGFSSLALLRRLPVDVLKIDQSFVRDMLHNPSDRAIVESVVQMAATFERGVMAEGIETLAHGALLLAIGCRFGQGNGIARPMPAEDLPAWIEQWRREAPWRSFAAPLKQSPPNRPQRAARDWPGA